MANLLEGQNSGVVVGVRATDSLAGSESVVVYKSVVPDGDWTAYRPTDERQSVYGGYDTESCTDFSCLNSVEAQITRMLQAGEVPQATQDKMRALGYFDAAGRVNFNDWYNAITAGTTAAAGNTLYGPWDAIKQHGLIPQADGPSVDSFTSDAGWFGQKPTADQTSLGKQWLTMFRVDYEWVDMGTLGQWDLFQHHLQQAPLHVLVPTGATWNNPTVGVPTPTDLGVNHAVTMARQVQGVSHTVWDHYTPFQKELEWGYYVPYALKGVVSLATPQTAPLPFQHTYTVNLHYGMGATKDVRDLQSGLQALGYMQAGLFGVYGDQTRAAVATLQRAHGIKDPDGAGWNFGPQTRAAANADLLKLA